MDGVPGCVCVVGDVWPGREREDFAGVDVDDGDGCGEGLGEFDVLVLVVVLDCCESDGWVEECLDSCLELRVYGESDVFSGFWIECDGFAGVESLLYESAESSESVFLCSFDAVVSDWVVWLICASVSDF